MREEDFIHGDVEATRVLRRHLQQHSDQAGKLLQYLLLRTYPRHEWGCLTRTEEASLRVLAEHLTGDDLTTVRRLFKRITKWYRVRSCEHCGVFHGDVGLRYCRDCFAAELLTGRREDYTVLNLGSGLRAEAIAQIANLATL